MARGRPPRASARGGVLDKTFGKIGMKAKKIKEPGQVRMPFERWPAVFPLKNRWVGCLQKSNGITIKVCGHLHRKEERAIECAGRRFSDVHGD
jgi:hypothetical protein